MNTTDSNPLKKERLTLKQQTIRTISFLAFFLFLASIVVDPTMAKEPAPKKPFTLTVLHTNDSHGHIEQYPLLATAVQQQRQKDEPTLLLHAGDVFTGTLYFTAYKGKADVDFMNRLEYDGMTIGNHEFDLNATTLADFMNDAEFPFLTCNVDVSKDEVLNKFFINKIKRRAKDGKIYPAIIKKVGGEKIGIIGVTTERTPILSNPGKNIRFLDATEQVKQRVEQLKAMGINKIILLSHIGLSEDKKIAKRVDGIDVIVGGHSHHALEKPLLVKGKEPTILVQAGEYLEHLGVLHLTFNEQGVLTDYHGKLVKLDEKSIPRDEKMENLFKKYKSEIEELADKKIGRTKVHLQGKRKKIRREETNLGNLISDSFLWKAKTVEPETHIAFVNGGSIRTSLPKGTITMADVWTVLPFESNLVLLEVTGEEIRQILENSVADYPSEDGDFLHVSGLRFAFNPKGKAGERIERIDVKTAKGTFQPIKGDERYRLVTTEFLAKGGEGDSIMKKISSDGRINRLSIKEQEALSDYIEGKGTVAPKKEGRIIIQKK